MESLKKMFAYMADRAKELSTWTGIVLSIGGYITVDPPARYFIWTVAALSVLLKDYKLGEGK